MANAAWQSTLDTLKQQLQGMDVSGTVTAASIPEGARAIFSQARAEKWDSNRKIFTYGQLDAALSIHCCRAGLIDWWTVHSGLAYFGDLGGMRKVHDACLQDPGPSPVILEVSAALTWACPHSVTDGVRNYPTEGVIRQLLDWGADPNYKDGEFFEKVLRQCGAGVIGAFLDAGGHPGTAYRVLDEMAAAKNGQGANISAAIAGRTLYAKVDENTLSETKHVPGPDGGGVFRTLFNFRARRVNEIYEAVHDRNPVMNGVAFADYDTHALDLARAKLEKLGGKPADENRALDKPRVPVRAPLSA